MKGPRNLIMMALALVFIAAISSAGTVFRINRRDVARGDIVTLSGDDLIAGRIFFSVAEGPEVRSMDISLDGGRTWKNMTKDGEEFVFRHRPDEEEKMNVAFLKETDAGTSIETANVTVFFSRVSPEEGIRLLFERMRSSYEAANKARFLDLISIRYPDRVKFEEAIQNDFYQYRNIRLFYRTERLVLDPGNESAIADVYWEKRFQDRQGRSFSESGVISMRLVKEGRRWQVDSTRGNNVFGSSLTALPDLSVRTADITNGYVGFDYVVNAIIRNVGSGAVSDFDVRFELTGAVPGTETVNLTVGPNSQVTVSHNFGAIVPVPGDVITVTIDPDNRILEENKDNNRATKTI